MAERAAERAAIARLPMADMADRVVHERTAPADDVREFEIALPGHGADFEQAAAAADIGKTLYPVEIDDVVGQHESHVEHRHERLSAGQEPRVVEAAEQGDDVGDRARIVVAERRWFHAAVLMAKKTVNFDSAGKPCLNPKNITSAPNPKFA